MAIERDKKETKLRVEIRFETDGRKFPKDAEIERLIYDQLDLIPAEHGLTVTFVEVRGTYK